MNEPPSVDLQQETDDRGVSFSAAFRACWLIVWGLVFPIAFLVAAAGHNDSGLWQSGQFKHYAILVFQWPNLAPIYPFVAFAAAGVVWAAWWWTSSFGLNWVRFALAAGFVVWVQIWVAWLGGMQQEFNTTAAIFCTLTAPLVGGFVALLGALLTRAVTGWQAATVRAVAFRVAGSIALLVVGITVGANVSADFAAVLYDLAKVVLAFGFIVIIVGLVYATPLAVVTYAWLVYASLVKGPKRQRFSLKWLMLLFAWFSANLAAWRVAMNLAVASYAQLPTSAPQDCFIATAAARRQQDPAVSDGSMPVNLQIRRIKSAEIVLRAAAPRLHAALRCVYNRLGPRAASWLTTRWLANLAYWGLKPCEWLAVAILAVAGVGPGVVDSLYRR